MQGDLLPCPFCGSYELSHGWSAPGYDGSTSTGNVECHNCNALIYTHGTEAEAIAAWNTRAPQPVADQQCCDSAGRCTYACEYEAQTVADRLLTSNPVDVSEGGVGDQQAAMIEGARIALEAAAKSKHDYWGAGEPACPREIKAGNGELHTLRCKKCGQDNPRSKTCSADLDPTQLIKDATDAE